MRESESAGVGVFYATKVSGYQLKTDYYVLCKPHSDHKKTLFYINKRERKRNQAYHYQKKSSHHKESKKGRTTKQTVRKLTKWPF